MVQQYLLAVFLQANLVEQVNMTLSPSNQSTSDDSSKLNHKRVDAERYALLKLHIGVTF